MRARRRLIERRSNSNMTGAMYAAISGLKTHMNKLNVIGNNIANVNTNAYKAGSTVFKTELYTTMTSGSNGTSTMGSVNPSQIGYGVSIGSIDIDMSTGNYSATGRALDCMIDGDGFFVVGDKTLTFDNSSDLSKLTLTRLGRLEFKADGYLTDNQGSVVYGFLCTGVDATTGNAIISDQLVPIRLPGYDTENKKIMYPTAGDDGTSALATATDDDGNEYSSPRWTALPSTPQRARSQAPARTPTRSSPSATLPLVT
jgi:flagellar hook protein FlgE